MTSDASRLACRNDDGTGDKRVAAAHCGREVVSVCNVQLAAYRPHATVSSLPHFFRELPEFKPAKENSFYSKVSRSFRTYGIEQEWQVDASIFAAVSG